MKKQNGILKPSKLSGDIIAAAALFVLFFFLPFAVHWRHILAGEVPFSGDGLDFVYGMQYLENSLKSGEIPFWTPYLAAGQPYADVTTLLYPVMLFCCFLPGVIQPYFYFGLHYAIGGTAMYAYLRRLKCSRFVSVCASVFYIFTAHMGGLRREHVGLIVTALYVPLVMYLLESYLEERRIKWLLLGSAAMALQFRAGFLQYVVYFDIFAFFYLLTSGIHRRMPWKRMLGHGAAWVAAYFGMIMGSAVPLLVLMKLLNRAGGSSMSLSGFSGLSIHPGKLVMMIFPYYFGGDVGSGMLEAGNYTSAVDIEIFLSAAAVCAIIAGLSLAKKNHHVRFMSAAGFLLLLYACMGAFPPLAGILYKVPVLNMFRVCSRTLFLFTFCCVVLLALSLEELLRSEEHMGRLKTAETVICAVSAVLMALYPIVDAKGVEDKLPMEKVFLFPLAMFAALLILQYALEKLAAHGKIKKELCPRVVAAAVFVSGIVQLAPFFAMSTFTAYDEVDVYPDELAALAGTDKVMMGIDSTQLTVRSNGAIARGIQTLDSYTNFNLPALYKYMEHTDAAPMNSSGMYLFTTGTVKRTIQTNNDLLSMLGVRYILLPEEESLDSLMSANGFEEGETVLKVGEVELEGFTEYSIAIYPLELEAKSFYRVSLRAEGFDDGETFYVDLYGDDYDSPEQEHHFYAEDGRTDYEAVLYSGDIPSVGAFYFRVIVPEGNELDISRMYVEELTPELQYGELGTFGEFKLFENRNAKPLLSAADAVVPISEEERDRLYLRTQDYDILNTAYILGGDVEIDFSGSDTQVGDILLRNNSVTAAVNTEDGGFITLSQTYYPGWRAYVDGRRTELYEVNGIIMGAFVPSGSHTVEFRYVPTSFYIGLSLTVLTIAVCAAAVVVSERKRRREATDGT